MDAMMIARYADLVESGHADADPDPATRQRVADMLRGVAYAIDHAEIRGTDAAVQHAYMLALTLRHPTYDAFTRVAEILRNMGGTN